MVIHGPNLNMLGKKEPDIYGTTTLEIINNLLLEKATNENIELIIKQSNHEGEIINWIQQYSLFVEGIIINPAAFIHYSTAIRDALANLSIPVIEVHLSNIYARESLRHYSIISPIAQGLVSGFGSKSYLLALDAIIHLVKNDDNLPSHS